MSVKRLVPLVVVFASTAHADVTRPQVNFAMAKAVGEIKACGARYTATFDWTAYDAVDWSKTGKTKQGWLGYEKGTLESLGAGVDLVCADPDCKAVLGGVDTIVYRITDDKRQRLSAKIDGKTLVFTNFTFGSTRFVDDFEKATRNACEAASLPAAPVPPAKQQTNAPATPGVVTPPAGDAPKAAPAPTAWDGTYQLIPYNGGGFGDLCPRREGLGALKVASGKLSLPWNAEDWRVSDSKPLRIGRVDGTVHADGTAVATATFDAPIWQSTTVIEVKIKRRLDSAGVKMRFSRDNDGTKLFALAVTIPGEHGCNLEWESGRPTPPPIAAPKPTPTKPNDHSNDGPGRRKVGYRAWSGNDCNAFVKNNDAYCESKDCTALVKRNDAYCESSDCTAILRGNDGYCESSDCTALLKNNDAYCQTKDCTAYVKNNDAYCETKTCTAILKHNDAYCD